MSRDNAAPIATVNSAPPFPARGRSGQHARTSIYPEHAESPAQSCRLPLSAPDGVWADRIVRLCRSPLRREEGAVRVADAGYDIVREAKRLQAWYLALTGEEETGGA